MGQKLPQAVFLDRDGTIGERGKKRSLLPDEFIPYSFLPDAIAALKAKGIRVISFTNQPWISRGEASYEALEKQLLSFGFDTVCICPHDDGDGCSCRKPLPGMLTNAAAASDLDLTDCIVIGDSWRDMLAAHSAGAKKILVKTGEGKKSLVKMNDEYPFVKIDHVCENLQEAAALILASNENTLCGGTDMLHLETITPRNVWDVIELEVYESQENFVSENTISIVQAYAVRDTETSAFPFGIYDGPTPVGFLMVGFNEAASYDDDERPPESLFGNYSIWRLMIDKAHQGKGFGRKAVQLALDFIRTWPCGEAEYCSLSYEPENEVAAALYHSFGFQENGEMDGDEIVAVLKL